MPLASGKDYIYTVVTKELKNRLKEQADLQNRSLSNYISYLLEQIQERGYLEKFKEVNKH
jgi:hypothetical protein